VYVLNPKEFTDRSPGELVKRLDGERAFIPKPLPPAQLDWNPNLLQVGTTAERLLGRLAGLGERVRNPQPLVRFFLRREAELSSRIEGTLAGAQTHARVNVQRR